MPGLKRIGLLSTADVSDDGFIALLTACPRLEEVNVIYSAEITFRFLKAILSSQHPLKRLTWYQGIGFVKNKPFFSWGGSNAIDKFRSLAREQQLVPVTIFEKSDFPKRSRFRLLQPANLFPDHAH